MLCYNIDIIAIFGYIKRESYEGVEDYFIDIFCRRPIYTMGPESKIRMHKSERDEIIKKCIDRSDTRGYFFVMCYLQLPYLFQRDTEAGAAI